MSWKLIENADRRRASEEVLLRPAAGGDVRVALGYPNVYRVGMSNLGMQVVYALFNSIPGVTCERFFLPDPDEVTEYRLSGRRLFTMESQRPVSEFDVIALTLAYEHDYVNLAQILDLAGLPLRAEGRGNKYPPVLVGGPLAMLNPEPVAPWIDAFCIGEGEPVIPAFVQAMRASLSADGELDKEKLLALLGDVAGMYVPSQWQDRFEQEPPMNRKAKKRSGATFQRYVGLERVSGFGAPLTRAALSEHDYARTLSVSQILSDDCEFGRTGLIEISRGCLFNCRYCTVGSSYPKVRWKPFGLVKSAIEDLARHVSKVGLISAAVGNYPEIEELCDFLSRSGLEVSFSSLRADFLPDCLLNLLARGGAKTITLAPEVGSNCLRRSLNKRFSDEQYLQAAERAFRAGITNLRMYSMLGIPGEEPADLEALLDLAERTRRLQVACGRGAGRITLSVGQLIPKPHTPFQWSPMLEVKEAEKRFKMLERGVAKIGGVLMAGESSKWAQIQGLLSRGDRRWAQVLEKVYLNGSYRSWMEAFAGAGIDVQAELYRQRAYDEPLPWSHIPSTHSGDWLSRDASRAAEELKNRSTPQA